MNTTNQTRNTNKRPVWWKFLQPRRRRHDRMLVLNMSLFNFEPGWNRIFKALPERENVWG
jgi:hypothetical protein